MKFKGDSKCYWKENEFLLKDIFTGAKLKMNKKIKHNCYKTNIFYGKLLHNV